MRNPKFNALLASLQDLYDSKNRDYSSDTDPYSNFTYAAKMSEIFTDPTDRVFATMIALKMARVAELGKGKVPNHESGLDSRRDLANYAIIWASLYTECVATTEDPYPPHDPPYPNLCQCEECGKQ